MKPTLNRFLKCLSKQGCRVGRKTRMLVAMSMLVLSGMNSGNSLSAQSTIGFDIQGLIGMPDTVANGEQWLVGAFVKNFSLIDSLANDSIQIVGYVDSLSGPVTPFALPIFDSINLNPNDTVFCILPIDFNTGASGFHIGNNVIVVWPISFDPNFNTQDSITVNVVVLDGISTGPDPEAEEIRCFPVPANGPLYVTSSNRSLVVKEIIIRDAAGKIVAVSDNPSTGILTDDWAKGIYLLEITFENGKRSVYKIIR